VHGISGFRFLHFPAPCGKVLGSCLWRADSRATPEDQRLAIARRNAEAKERRAILAANANANADTPTSNPRFDIHRGARASLTPPTQKSAVLCTHPPAGEHHTKKAGDARQPKEAPKTTHTQAPRDARATPAHSELLRTACAPHAHPLLPTVMAFVSYGFVLIRVRVRKAKSALGSFFLAGISC
jgi:hypothetical protein